MTTLDVFVTGASRGIGYSISSALAPEARNLLITSRDEARLSSAQDRLAKTTEGNVTAITANLDQGYQAAEALAKWVNSHVEKLDVVVLNAGYYVEGKLLEADEATLRRIFECNFFSNVFLVQQLMPLVEKGDLRRIIIIGSTASYDAYPLVPTYGMAKFALRGFALNLRHELREKNVGVTYLSPGGTWTDMWEGEELPRDRLLEPDDIAALVRVVLMLSPQAVVDEVIVRPMQGDLHD